MDVDGDLDSQLLQQFSSMATTDKEVLIAEFQRLLGNRVSVTDCAFFLDMNNWNLQAAVCSFFEYDQSTFQTPQMSFVKDVTIGEGESVTPNTKFTKTWRIQNTGDDCWPGDCFLKFVAGQKFGSQSCISVKALLPGEIADISIEMVSPSEPGIHQGQWKMCTGSGLYFGEFIWVILQVEEGGVLSVTQLLSQFGGDLASSQGGPLRRPSPSTENPFMSPSVYASNSYTGDRADLVSSGTNAGSARHSSLPSSPRWLGEERVGLDCHLPILSEPLRVRSVLFQTPDNSPSKTIGSRSSTVVFPPQTTLPSGTDLDSMES